MGEVVCLARSFSQRAEISSLETNEAVVPHRILTESVSFGRFASESLHWQKWSSFSQNRYVEEAERFIKPGSVAQKKAFFEAHFGTTIFNAETTKDNIVEAVGNAEVVSSVAPSIHVTDETTDFQSVENLNSTALDEEKATSSSKERRSGSLALKICSTSSKLEPPFAIRLDPPLTKTRKKPPSSSKRSVIVSKNQNRTGSEPFQTSRTPLCNTDNNIVRVPQNGSRNSTNAKDKKKGLAPRTAHKSLNIVSSTCQTTKPAPKSSTMRETASSNARFSVFPNGNKPIETSKSRKRPLSRKAKHGSDAAKCSTSASTVRLTNLLPPKNQPSENKRLLILPSSTIPKNFQRKPSGISKNLSSHSRSREKCFTIASPFNFQSDERAEKRKEFFKKVEEKKKKEDAAKEQFSCGFKANHNTPVASEQHKNPQVPLVPRFHKNQAPGKEKTKKSHKVVSSMEKYKRCKIHPSSRLKKNMRELKKK